MAAQYLESTDDAYVKADYTTVAPKISGYVAEILVQDNERVKAGQILARIDARDFKTALERAQADIEAAEAAIRNVDAQLVLQHSVIDQRKADIAATEATLKFAQEERVRYQELVKTGAGAVQSAQRAEAMLREKTAQLQRDRAGLVAARQFAYGAAVGRGASAQTKPGARQDRQAVSGGLSALSQTIAISGQKNP